MKILIVSSYLPFPLLNGGNIRLYNLIKELSTRHEITLICEKRSHQTEADINELKKFCKKVITYPRKKQWSLGNIVKAGFSDHSFLITGHSISEMREGVTEELKSNTYDLIHIETFYVFQNVLQTSLPTVLVEHNIEYLVYERYKDKASLLFRPLLSLDIRKMKKDEEKAWRRASVVATVSGEEKKYIKKDKVFVVPNGVDVKTFTLKKPHNNFMGKEKKILYIGDYKWVQNSDAVTYIIKEIWPILKVKLQNVPFSYSLWIVGRHMQPSMKKLGEGDPSIHFDDENSDSAAKIFSDADVLLAPKRVGGGTSYKTLESMAVGTPVVTTKLGLEGLTIRPNEDILIADSPEGLAEKVVEILTNEKKYHDLSIKSRKAVEEKYAWPAITTQLENVYKEALQK